MSTIENTGGEQSKDTKKGSEGGEGTVEVIDGDEGDDEGAGAKDNGGKERPKETPEAKVARLRRELARAEKHTGGEKVSKSDNEPKSDDLDYGQKAYLVSKGIQDAEFGLVKEIMRDTGKTLEAVLGSKHFQAELKGMRDDAAAKGAIPNNTGRSAQTTKDTVDYWLAKGELPPNNPENRKLRQDVVNARLKSQKDDNVFTGTPVVQ